MALTNRPDIDAIEARANAATPAPWEDGACSDDVPVGTHAEPIHSCVLGFRGNVEEIICEVEGNGPDESQDMEFIAHARADVPALIAYVRELEKDKARLDFLDQRRSKVHYGRIFETQAEYEMYRDWYIRSERGGFLREAIDVAMEPEATNGNG